MLPLGVIPIHNYFARQKNMSEEFKQAQTVTIAKLLEKEYEYIIPDYQRGYRWQCSHICEFMDDVWRATEKDWNCIQPIIVSWLNDKKYTLIDGQQRLTTIDIILKELKKNRFKLNREDVINPDEDEINEKFKQCAQKTVEKWFEKHPEIKVDEFNRRLREYTKVIWYKVEEKDAIEVFTRININRIPLTAADLLKAMFLRKLTTEGDIDKQQIEISHQWNEIESTLQDDRFWLMFNDKNDQDSCRISRIFRIAYACKNQGDNGDTDGNESCENDSENAVFRYFVNKIRTGDTSNTNEDSINKEFGRIKEIWKEIENIYRTLCDWYEDIDTFHLVCMYVIINKRATISKLYAEWKSKTRKEFRDLLRKEIKKSLFGDDSVGDKIEKCDYRRNPGQIKNILLLHNVATTMLRNWPQHRWKDRKSSNERHLKNMCSRFPFHMYKIAKWNLEHISPCSGDSTNPKQREIFITCLKGSLEDGILKQKMKNGDSETLNKLIEKFEESVKNKNTDTIGQTTSEILDILIKLKIYIPLGEELQHSIKNITLLDEGTNKSYGNKFYVDKRNAILERVSEKNEDTPELCMNEYSFIMPCTLNAFSKVYSQKYNDLLFWGIDDAMDYGNDMIKTISHFLALESENENN